MGSHYGLALFLLQIRAGSGKCSTMLPSRKWWRHSEATTTSTKLASSMGYQLHWVGGLGREFSSTICRLEAARQCSWRLGGQLQQHTVSEGKGIFIDLVSLNSFVESKSEMKVNFLWSALTGQRLCKISLQLTTPDPPARSNRLAFSDSREGLINKMAVSSLFNPCEVRDSTLRGP